MTKKIAIIGGIILVVLAGIWFFGVGKEKSHPKFSCNPLTPLMLEQFESASGVRPIEGEKCEIFSLPRGFLIKLGYNNAEEMMAAKLNLIAGTEGEKKIINGNLDWVVLENDSSVFLTFPDKNPNALGVLVLPEMGDENEVKFRIKSAIESGV